MTDLRDKIARALFDYIVKVYEVPESDRLHVVDFLPQADAVLAVLDLDKIRAEALEEESLHLREQISHAQETQKTCDPARQRWGEYDRAITHMTQEANRLMLRADRYRKEQSDDQH